MLKKLTNNEAQAKRILNERMAMRSLCSYECKIECVVTGASATMDYTLDRWL